MDVLPEEESVTIVLLGNFNPPIFVPQWFQTTGLIDVATANSAKIEIIHPGLAIFATDWFRLQVEAERMVLAPLRTASVRAYDLCLRMFTEFLPHTPLRAIGLNYLAHYRVPSWDALYGIGDQLAPKTPWGVWGKEILAAPKTDQVPPVGMAFERSGGLRSMTMEQSFRPDGLQGYIRAKVELSEKYAPGLYFEINDHYVVAKADGTIGRGMAAMNLKFDQSMNRSKWIIAQIMRQVGKQ